MKLSLLKKSICILLCTVILQGIFAVSYSGANSFYSRFFREKNGTDIYTQQIQSCNAGASEKSKAKGVTFPQGVKVMKMTSKSDNSVSILWKRVRGIDGYAIYIYNDILNEWTLKAKTYRTTNFFTFNNLREHTKYRFCIRTYRTVNGTEVYSKDRICLSAVTYATRNSKKSQADSEAPAMSVSHQSTVNKNNIYSSVNKRNAEAKTNAFIHVFRHFLNSFGTDNTSENSFADLPNVTGLTASASYDRITVSWNRIDSADGYILYRFNSKKIKWYRYAVVYSNENSYTFTGLDDSTKYTFAVSAVKNIGENEIRSKSFADIEASTLPHSITGLTVTVCDTSAKITWNENANIDRCFVFAAASGKKATLTPTEPIAATSGNYYILNGLKPSVEYRFSVSGAYDENGFDVTSAKKHTLPKSVHLTSSFTDDKKVKLEWEERKSADSYIVYTRLPGEKWKKLDEITDTSIVFENIKSKKYYAAVISKAERGGLTLYSEPVKCCILNSDNAKSMYVDGDSIAFGKGAHGYSYAAMYAEKHNINMTNLAFGGATLASGIEGCNPIAESVINNVNSSYDIIMLDGGLNDYYFSAELGNIADGGATDFDMSTTCGALEAMLSHIKETCPNSKTYFVSVHKVAGTSTPNDKGLTYERYRDSIIRVCKKYSVTVIDCYNSNLDSSLTYTKNGIFQNGDGVHPTEEGYRKYYLPIIEKVMDRKNQVCCNKSKCNG